MPTVLVDTAAWIALVNTRDELHKPAEDMMTELRRREATLVTTEFVLLEVANYFCTVAWRDKAIRLINGLRLMSNLSNRAGQFIARRRWLAALCEPLGQRMEPYLDFVEKILRHPFMNDLTFKVCAKVCVEQNGRLDAARKLLKHGAR